MASVRSLTDEQRKALAGLQAVMRSELLDIWDKLDLADVAKILPVLDDVIAELYSKYGDVSGALAGDFYEEVRALAGANGRFTPILSVLTDEQAREKFAIANRRAVGPLFGANPRPADALTNVFGSLSRAVLDVHRDTVSLASVQDRASRGWMRIGDGRSCPFCSMLISRGDVYKASTVRFASHDHCGCSAVPTFDGTPNYYGRKKLELLDDGRRATFSTRRDRTDNAKRLKSNKALRDWIEANPDAG